MRIFRVAFMFMLIIIPTLLCADDQWTFITNSVLDVFNSAFSWLIALVVFVVAVISVINGANWLTAGITAVVLITLVFAAPNIIKKMKTYAQNWNPQSGLWSN